jgi:dTDP-glucose 4,6-dehydratase
VQILKKNKVYLKKFGKFKSKLIYVKDRPGHDFRYSIDSSKIKNILKWQPLINFDKGLEVTINWYLDNDKWISEKLQDKYKIKRIG